MGENVYLGWGENGALLAGKTEYFGWGRAEYFWLEENVSLWLG